MFSGGRKKRPMQGKINTLHGYFSSSVETKDSMCRRIITNLVTHTIVEPSEFANDILDDMLTSVVKNTKHSLASVNITPFKLCSWPKYTIHFIVGGRRGIVYYPIKIKISQLFQKQGVITQLTKTLTVALTCSCKRNCYTWSCQRYFSLVLDKCIFSCS